MISIEQLDIFKKYGGIIDRYYYAKSKHLKVLPESEFGLIEKLPGDLRLVVSNLAADSYKAMVEEKLKETCEDQNTIDYFRKMATLTNL